MCAFVQWQARGKKCGISMLTSRPNLGNVLYVLKAIFLSMSHTWSSGQGDRGIDYLVYATKNMGRTLKQLLVSSRLRHWFFFLICIKLCVSLVMLLVLKPLVQF